MIYKGLLLLSAFEVINNSEQLELNSESIEIQIANTPTIRNLIMSVGDIRRSTVVVRTIFPDNLNARVEEERTQINSLTFNKGVIVLDCNSPLTAINGLIPSRVFEPKNFPALPFFNSPNINRNI